MEAVAERYFRDGDMQSAASLYCNLVVLHPRYVKMARVCRVLADPLQVPQPHRYADAVEALLEPSVTPEALFGVDATPQDVNKAYQRWTLLVHPDKNPYPRAGEAFGRLVTLKTIALDAGSRPIDKLDKKHNARGGSHTQRGVQPNGKPDAPVAQKRPTDSLSSSLKAAEIGMTLSEMKNVQVTLKSLKRKDLDDSELPELSTTFRSIRERRFLSHLESPVTSSVSPMPTQAFPMGVSGSSPHTAPSCAPNFMSSPPLQTASRSPPPNSSLPEAEARKEHIETTFVTKHSLPHVRLRTDGKGQPNTNSKRNALGKQEKLSHVMVQEKKTCNQDEKTSKRLAKAKLEMKGTVYLPGNTSLSCASVSVSGSGNDSDAGNINAEQDARNINPEQDAGNINAEQDARNINPEQDAWNINPEQDAWNINAEQDAGDSSIKMSDKSLADAAKKGINELIRGLQEMKTNRTPLRLNCDLSFAAYERERGQQQPS